ncbi:MAG: hypothetical protein ACJ74U_13230 [Jatrophihabitantaceae bacterium]
MSKLTNALGALAGMLLAITSASGTASAAPPDKGTFHDISTITLSCDSMQLSGTEVADGRFLGVQRGPDGFVYYLEVSTHTMTWTNVANGKSMIQQAKGLYLKDQTITDNGDGTITIADLSSSRVSVYGPDGRLAYQVAGVATYAFLIDDNGTPLDPTDDTFLASLGVLSQHGLDNAPGSEIPGTCAEATALLS